jgi:hypothetical protein
MNFLQRNTVKQREHTAGGLKAVSFAVATLLILAGCEGDDGRTGNDGVIGPAGPAGMNGSNGTPGADGANGNPGFAAASFFRANNGTTNMGMVDLINQNGGSVKGFTTGNNEGLQLDRAGSLVQAGDGANVGIRTVCTVGDRGNGGSYDPALDREISGASTGLVMPKGIDIAHGAGLIFVANVNGNNILVFGSSAAGDVAPVGSTDLGSLNAWDVDYVEEDDRLFVAMTNGTVQVFDAYVAGGFSDTADRTITPVDGGGTKISVNLHGIVYHQPSDRLVVSDVGSATVADDGQIFVISSARSANGNVQPSRVIAGPSTLLGNPVDIVLSGTDLRVAEKSNDLILVFANIFDGASGDIAPDLVSVSVKPESLVESLSSPANPDVSDIFNDSELLLGLAVAANPPSGGANQFQINRVSTALSAQLASFNTGLSLENVSFDLNGDGYATFDDGANTNGGILIINRLHSRTGIASPSRERMIIGAATGLVSPKGIDVATDAGLVFVAENNATTPAVLVFSACASGNVAPLATIATGGRPWDMDYDAISDQVFIALTNGNVAVYNGVLNRIANGTAFTTPDAVITPSVSGVPFAAPTNIHGIDYDVQSDSLFLSDVGDAANAADGKIFVIPAASTANGNTDVVVNIQGASTLLGNPVDITFDGRDLYVAEKSNNLIMRFNNILESVGGDIAPSQSFSFLMPESIALVPAYLGNEPGF